MGYGGLGHPNRIVICAAAGFAAVAVETGLPLDWANLSATEKKKYEEHARQIIEATDEQPAPPPREHWQAVFTQAVTVMQSILKDID
jgi:hypothetical protein